MKIHIQERKVKKQAQINEPVFLSPYDKHSLSESLSLYFCGF